jgi:hypothetical protein
LPAEPSQVGRSGIITMATAGDYAVAALLWLVLSAVIISAWILLFKSCSLTVSRWGVDFCPRPMGQVELSKEQVRSRELAAVLASIKSELVNRAPCEMTEGSAGR